MQTTVNLSEKAYRNLSSLADLTKQTIDEVIEDTFESRFEMEIENLQKSVSVCSDEEVLALANLKMPKHENERMSSLLRQNKEGELSAEETTELSEIIGNSQIADLRKAIGIVEAVKRGLIESAEGF